MDVSESRQAAAVAALPQDADLLDSRWDDAIAAQLKPEELLLYPSNLRAIQPARPRSPDHPFRRRQHIGQAVGCRSADGRVGTGVVVKGSGGDLGTMKLDGFAS